MTFSRLRRTTLIVMAVVAVICALATATWVGYHVGRRAGRAPSSLRQRTSRVALCRLAVSLLVLITARRIRQSFRAERALPDVVGIWRLRTIGPVDLLRAGVARMLSS